MKRIGTIFIKTLLWMVGIVVGLILLIFLLIRIPAVQNYLVTQVTAYLEKKIETPFRIGYVSLDLPKMLVLEDIYIEDRARDTLLAGEELRVDINLFRLFRNVVEINRVDLVGITANVHRNLPDSAFNFAYIIDAFVDPDRVPPEDDTPLVIDMDRINLERIQVAYHDEVLGLSTRLRLGELRTRVRTFDLTGDMHFEIPEIAIEGLSGHLEQWASSLSPEDSIQHVLDQPPVPAESDSRLPRLELGRIKLADIDFAYRNLDMALDTRFAIDGFDTRLERLDLNESIVAIDHLRLNGSRSHIIFGKTEPAMQSADDSQDHENASIGTADAGWNVTAKEIRIRSTDFVYRDDNTLRIPNGFDYGNIRITALNGELDDLYYSTDSIAGDLRSLSATDGSGFQIRQLQSKFSYTSRGAELDGLYAETPHTLIRDFIQISYPSLDAAASQPGQIGVRADLQRSHLGMRDVLYFIPDLDTMTVMAPLWGHTFYVDGQLMGRVDNLRIPSLRIRTLDHTVIDASAHLRGLPEIEQLHATLRIHTLTTGRGDLDQLIAQELMPDSITLPESIALSGTFDGGMTGFDTDLQLETSAGNASLEGLFRTRGQSGAADTTYRGRLAIMDVDLGRILNMDSTLGTISFAADVEGRGLDPKTADAALAAELITLDAMGYRYSEIQIDASIAEGEFLAVVESPDPNIDFDLRAAGDLRGTYPRLGLTLAIDSVNLRNLNLMEDEFRYHGKLVADLETADIDHLNGTIEIHNSAIAYNQKRYTVDIIRLLASADEQSNTMQFTSEFLNAHLVGNYQLSQLNSAIQDIVAVYYQPDSIAPHFEYEPQRFDFSATLKRSRVVRDLLPELTEMEDVLLDGSFNSEDKFLLAKAVAPNIVYGGTTIQNVSFDITTFDSTMYYTALIERIAISQVELSNTLLSGTVLQNQLDFGLWIKDQDDEERYHLGIAMEADAGNFLVSLKEDGLMLNYDQWVVNPANSIRFGRDGIRVHQFILSQNGQQLIAQSQDSVRNAPIDLIFDNFRIETFSEMLESEVLNMGGGINGKATVSRLDANPLFVSDIQIDRFYFGRDTVGDILINVHNQRENTYTADVQIVGNGNQVRLSGDFLAPPDESARLDFVLDLQPLDMYTLEAFSLGYIRNTSGNLTGKLSIKGTTEAPLIDGALVFNKAELNVAMLNATIRVDQQRVTFDRQGIRFNRFELRDRRNNLARLDGRISTKTYAAFDFDLGLTADEFQLLNSTQQDNDLFYGQLFVSSSLKMTGTLNNPVVNGNLLLGENTDVTFVLPNENPGLVEREGIVRFVDRSDTARVNVFARLDSLRTTEISGLRLSMNIQSHESAQFTIVLDPGSEDALNIRGSADLTAGIDPSGDITLTGTYTVEDGSYSFTFEPVTRVFNFRQGSTITWTGDPMDAQLDITAVYKLRAPTLELVQSQVGADAALYKQRVPFDVNLGITGQMLRPDLNFWIDLDEENALVSQDVATKVNTALNQLEENESEMNKQVFALIVLGRFMATNPFESLSGGGVESMARNSVSSLLSAQLNRLASDLIRGVELDFDLQSGSDYSTGTMQNRTDLNIGVSKMLFDDRLKVTIGSSFELEGQARPGEQTTNIAGDISVDYQLSKDGRYLVRVYRKNQYQVTLQGQFVETGIGFIINMDYDEFREIFTGTKEAADMFSMDTREFRQRFDRDRMETDSVYRDSVRQVLRDSLERADPEFRKRMEERRQRRQMREKRRQQPDSTAMIVPRWNLEALTDPQKEELS